MSALVTSRSDSLLGRQVCGEYVIEELLRTGPLATAYSAVGSDDGERYVVRVLHRTRGGIPANFRTEMDRMQAIQHRAITPVVAYSVAPWGVTVVSRAVGECTLRQRLDEGALSDAETGWLVCEVAAALDALHGAHPPIVHQSLCPQNIVLGPEGSPVWVEECGLANALAAAGWLSGPVDGYGELGYLSPDDMADRRDPRSDVFVLASIAYECLTGVRAFAAKEARHPEAFTRSPPLVRLTHPTVAAEVDAALTRAWRFQDPLGFESASAFAMEFARGLMAESGRATPVVSLPSSKPSRSGMRPLPENDVSDPDVQAIDAAFDDMWNVRHTKEYIPQPSTAPRPIFVPSSSPAPASPSQAPTAIPEAVPDEFIASPVPISAPPPPPPPSPELSVASPIPPRKTSRPPAVPSQGRHTPTLRWSSLPPSLAEETPLPIETIEPEHAVRIPLREALTAPSLLRRSPQPPPEDEPATIAPPSKYGAWANQVSRPGSPVAPPPTDDEGMRNTPVLIPPAPAMPTTVAPTPPTMYERPVLAPLAPAPAPRTISRRPSARPVARVTALPIITTRGSLILGGSIVLAAVILAGSHVYVSRMAAHDRRHETAVSAQSAPYVAPVAAPPSPAVTPAALPPVVSTTVATPTAPTPADALPEHPSDHDVAAVQEHLVPLVASCQLEPQPRRRVRVRVTYVGATGQPAEATTRGHYGHTAAAPCIAAAAREVPVPRFSADRWTWDYVFAAP